MALEHILTESDTLYSLAEKYLRDPNRWEELVDYNGLDAPYLVSSRSEVEDLYGNGYVTLTRMNTSSDVFVRKGWRVRTKPYLIGGLVKEFEVTTETHIPRGVASAHVHVRSVVKGSYGNIAEGLIAEVSSEFAEQGINVLRVTNEKAFEGGKSIKLLTVGDSIYIPIDDPYAFIPDNMGKHLEYLGGEDLYLSPRLGYARYVPEDAYGDLESVSGIENIEQAVNDRLMTEKGELPLHPEYGTNLALLIGTQQTPYTKKLVEIEIYEALAYEDRITDVKITRLEIEGTSISVDIAFRPSFATRDMSLSLSLNFGRGGN